MNHLLLHMLVGEIADNLYGHRIEAVRLLHPIASIELGARSKRSYLVVLLSTPGPFCFVSERDPIGETGTPVLKRVYGTRVASLPDPPVDRIFRMPLDSGENLAIYLFGSSARVRLEGAGRIVESLQPTEAGSNLHETLATDRVPFVTIDAAALASGGHEPKSVSNTAPGLETTLAECFVHDGEVDTESLCRFRDSVLSGTNPFLAITDGRIGRVTPAPVDAPDTEYRFGPFDTATEACLTVGFRMLGDAFATILGRHMTTLGKLLRRREKLIAQLRGELSTAEQFDVGREEADILAAYQGQVPAGATEVELPDLYREGKRTIRLDPSTPIATQIKKRYKHASKLERSRGALEKRIAELTKESKGVEKVLSQAEKSKNFNDAYKILATAVESHGLARPKRETARVDPKAKQYRRYDLDKNWFVLVGRNDRENDDITFRVSSPDDLWMHAQHVPGSHVVLRTSGSGGNPPKKILERAAAIAAFYSKSRHSNTVPVIYTQRKYVRKFRGARPGQVRCEREKTLFVEPLLPEDD